MFHKMQMLRELFKRSARTEDASSKLGFALLQPESANVIEESGHNPRRVISKSGNGYLYSLEAAITPNDTRCMEIAKAHFLSYACSLQSPTLPSIKEAQSIARARLMEIASPEKADLLSYMVAHDTAGYGPISILLEDRHNIEEIEVNSPDSSIIVYSTRYGRCITNLRFNGEHSFRSAINRLIRNTEKELGENTPIIDSQVADIRIHAQIRPYALSGAAASIRVGGRKEIDLNYILKSGTTTPDVLAYLWIALESRQNIIISGAPASGKTTLLSALTAMMPSNEKIVTIEEDINEIRRESAYNMVGLYGSRYNSVGPKEQVINSLRMRPDRIIVGEMRGEEAKDLLMGANIGISFAATMHSGDGGMQILKKLMVKPMCVETKSLSMLDAAVYMRQIDINGRSISGIFEYKWLSRGEADEGVEIGDEDMVNITDIVSGAKPNLPLMRGSKALSAYSRLRRISQKDAAKEFDRRSRLISECFECGKDIGKEVTKYCGW